tara:strand:- start:383 stop:592 length:210 start_codon:yes stop_codon:yes gene_type:complete
MDKCIATQEKQQYIEHQGKESTICSVITFSQTYEENLMAKTQSGKKKVHVPAHTRNGKKVREHYRSTPN